MPIIAPHWIVELDCVCWAYPHCCFKKNSQEPNPNASATNEMTAHAHVHAAYPSNFMEKPSTQPRQTATAVAHVKRRVQMNETSTTN